MQIFLQTVYGLLNERVVAERLKVVDEAEAGTAHTRGQERGRTTDKTTGAKNRDTRRQRERETQQERQKRHKSLTCRQNHTSWQLFWHPVALLTTTSSSNGDFARGLQPCKLCCCCSRIACRHWTCLSEKQVPQRACLECTLSWKEKETILLVPPWWRRSGLRDNGTRRRCMSKGRLSENAPLLQWVPQISPEKVLELMYLSLLAVQDLTEVAHETAVSHTAVADMHHVMRRARCTYMKMRLGGQNKVVLVDESFITRRKHNKGGFVGRVTSWVKRGSICHFPLLCSVWGPQDTLMLENSIACAKTLVKTVSHLLTGQAQET